MALKTRTVKWVTALLALSVTGLVAVQSSLLAGAFELEESAFQGSVSSALSRTSESLAVGEASTFFLSVTDSIDISPQGAVMTFITTDSSMEVDQSKISMEHPRDLPYQIAGDMIRYTIQEPQHVRISARTLESDLDSLLVDSLHYPGEYEIYFDSSCIIPNVLSWEMSSVYPQEVTEGVVLDQVNHGIHVDHIGSLEQFAGLNHDLTQMRITGALSTDSGKRRLVGRVMQNFMRAEFEQIEDRLDSINIDSIIHAELEQSGIDLDYVYAVYTDPADSARVISDTTFTQALSESDFRVRLFQQDVFAPAAYLSLFFPDHRMFLWKKITPMLAATAIFALLIIGSFSFSIRSLIRQRRVSDLMVEFINNMTHEFKTPIATVSLAAEAISREDIRTDPEKITRFNEMIKSETTRMRGQTEKILQMAALEELTLELAPVEVDLHAILEDAICAFDLRVSDSSGSITRDFRATKPLIEADKIHLNNIAHNLLDNASKYSNGSPKIIVRTFDSDRGIGFRIEDQGIGINQQDQKQVFDKYYRASTGNVHNVKGFGLGLSYVKLIVEQHQGEIVLHSVPGEGTEVEIILPRKQNKESGSKKS